jgi:hypothetical protein
VIRGHRDREIDPRLRPQVSHKSTLVTGTDAFLLFALFMGTCIISPVSGEDVAAHTHQTSARQLRIDPLLAPSLHGACSRVAADSYRSSVRIDSSSIVTRELVLMTNKHANTVLA